LTGKCCRNASTRRTGTRDHCYRAAEQRDELAPSQVGFADYNQPADLLLWPMSESGKKLKGSQFGLNYPQEQTSTRRSVFPKCHNRL
jgi:hypothetical protein